MQTTLALMALAASIGSVSAQGVAAGSLLPTTATPEGCSQTYDGSFEITVVLPNAKRDLEKRSSCASSGILVASLSNGILTDAAGRIGGIVANHQFQFDGPPSQTGTIINGGFSVCNNGSLALGGSAIFYQCQSGSFYNLYDDAAGSLCEQVLIDIIPCSGASSSGSPASQASDGQPTGVAATTIVSQISDGQPQAASATPVSQFTDGQIQVTALPGPAVSQISDGQVQATSAAPAVATTVAAPVSQISDGQVQATSAAPAPVSQISDGQVQATSAAPAATVVPVSQISDGQIQATSAVAPAANATTSALPSFTGAANSVALGANVLIGAIAVGVFAVL